MTDFEFNQCDVLLSKTEKQIPMVGDVRLHSIYDPEKEARLFTEKNMETLQNREELLILGLGFGYHINEIVHELVALYKNKFKVVIIEPNKHVYNKCVELGMLSINLENIKIYSGQTIDELYSDRDLIDYLVNKPGVIAHTASFNLYKDFFTAFLSYKASKKTGEITKRVLNGPLKEYLSLIPSDLSLDNYMENKIKGSDGDISELDNFMYSFFHMTRTAKDMELSK